MTDPKHPLTDKICRQIAPFSELWAPTAECDDMRAAADWQLEQVIEWLKNERKHDFEMYNDPKQIAVYTQIITDLKKAMRPQEDDQIKKDNAAGSLLEPVVMWEVWMEGYLCTGMEGRPATASYQGQWPGKTFKDACQAWCDADKSRKQYFNPDRLTYWGCRLYDHEIAISNRSGKAMRPQEES